MDLLTQIPSIPKDAKNRDKTIMSEKPKVTVNLEQLEKIEEWAKPFKEIGAKSGDYWRIVLKNGTEIYGNDLVMATCDMSGSISAEDTENRYRFDVNNVKSVSWFGE